MGVPIWAFLITGVLVGQVSVLIPLAGWAHLAPRAADIEGAVARAVTESLRGCLDSESTTTTTTTVPWPLGGPGGLGIALGIGLVFLFLVLVAIGCLCIPFWLSRVQFAGQAREDRPEVSPKSPSLSIENLARNQLATLRVRHAQQSNRAPGI